MPPLKTSLSAALLSVVLTAGLLYYLNQRRAHEAAVLRRANNVMRVQASRRHQVHPATPAVPVSRAGASSTGEGLSTLPLVPATPAENHRNAGQATPRDTLNTFAWACERADAEMVGKMLHFDPVAREMAEGILAGLPDAERARFKTVDEMAAAMLTLNGLASPFPDEAVLAAAVIEPLGEDRARFRLPGTAKDGIQLQKTGEAWRYVITEAMVTAYLKNLDRH
jgi:hypothetical protein